MLLNHFKNIHMDTRCHWCAKYILKIFAIFFLVLAPRIDWNFINVHALVGIAVLQAFQFLFLIVSCLLEFQALYHYLIHYNDKSMDL